MQFFFSKTSFLTSPQSCKTLFWHNVTLFVFLNMPAKHYKNGETVKNSDQLLTLSLGPYLTLKPINLGPVLNFTAFAYTYRKEGGKKEKMKTRERERDIYIYI